MPLLPKRNNLDYNPNSIVNASKTIKTIALENMKNPVLDPDMKTLSSMDAERNLGVNLDYLGQMYLDIERSLIRIAQFAGTGFLEFYTGLEGAGMCGGASTASEMSGLSQSRYFDPPAKKKKAKKIPVRLVIEDDTEEEPVLATPAPRRRGRPKGSKNKPKPPPIQPSSLTALSLSRQPSLQMSAPLGSIRGTASNPSIASRYSSRPVSSSGNSQATPMYDDDPDYDPDDDASSLPSSASVPSSRTNRSMRSGRSIYTDASTDYAEENKTISQLLLSLIQKVQRMDFFLTSRIKPAYAKINQKQQEKLSEMNDKIVNLYNLNFRNQQVGRQLLEYHIPNQRGQLKTLENYIVWNIDNGDELLQYLEKALNKLILDMSVVLNSARKAGGVELALSPADNYALTLAGFSGDPTGRMERANTGSNLFPNPKEYIQPDYTNLGREGLMYKLQTFKGDPEARPYYRSEGLRRRGITAPTARKMYGYGRYSRMTGCGRNFYGETINNSRDIPTIWTSVRDCPTKYLL